MNEISFIQSRKSEEKTVSIIAASGSFAVLFFAVCHKRVERKLVDRVMRRTNYLIKSFPDLSLFFYLLIIINF